MHAAFGSQHGGIAYLIYALEERFSLSIWETYQIPATYVMCQLCLDGLEKYPHCLNLVAERAGLGRCGCQHQHQLASALLMGFGEAHPIGR